MSRFTVPKGFHDAGVRLAIRLEGEVINAYLAEVESDEGMIFLSSLSKAVIDGSGGRDGAVFNGWMEVLKSWMNACVAEVTGTAVEQIKTFTFEAGGRTSDAN